MFCYALSLNDGSEWGIHIQSELEHFIDVSSLSFDATTRRIKEDHIEVLIDLKGYMKPKHSDYGQPEDKFLFACFNHLSNMDPEIFMTWCNILKRVPNSVFWLLRFPPAVEKRLCASTRVAGSDFLAIRLGDDIIVSSMKEYEEKAVSLLLNCPKLQDLTNRLKAACLSYPLFNA
ncbi:hypothetical protein CQW23_16899 [Capsicum baccatum]|uniref:O-GlcNAc transferase C-terminal domain-containing protein n=1 Tax=Capsicum baccatum TaxID=33114 RepID=A0A2G2WC92_CAPBA|nr:hypothetical protein CQW23_16899 [Capsicum baccatum]